MSPIRAELEKRVIAGESARAISDETKCSRRQLLNHFARGHVEKAIKLLGKSSATAVRQTECETRGAESAGEISGAIGGLMSQATQILQNVTQIYDDAISNGHHGMALAAAQKQMNAVARVKELLEMAGKLSGEYDQKTLNLYVLPEWKSVMIFLVDTLAPYPEAREAVIAGLRARVKRMNVDAPELEGPRHGLEDQREVIDAEAVSV